MSDLVEPDITDEPEYDEQGRKLVTTAVDISWRESVGYRSRVKLRIPEGMTAAEITRWIDDNDEGNSVWLEQTDISRDFVWNDDLAIDDVNIVTDTEGPAS